MSGATILSCRKSQRSLTFEILEDANTGGIVGEGINDDELDKEIVLLFLCWKRILSIDETFSQILRNKRRKKNMNSKKVDHQHISLQKLANKKIVSW